MYDYFRCELHAWPTRVLIRAQQRGDATARQAPSIE